MVHFSFGMKKPERESVSAVGMEVYWRSGVIDLRIAGRLSHGC
jgi:hypothetical protein